MINKNFNNTDFREVIIVEKSSEAPVESVKDFSSNKINLLSDLVIDTSKNNIEKIIASIFLLVKTPFDAAQGQNTLLLKPRCLWLQPKQSTNSPNATALMDYYKREGNLIPNFAAYSNQENLKAGYLNKPETVKSILTLIGIQGVSDGAKIDGLSNVFMYDLNEGNRLRAITSSAPSANIVQSSRWV